MASTGGRRRSSLALLLLFLLRFPLPLLPPPTASSGLAGNLNLRWSWAPPRRDPPRLLLPPSRGERRRRAAARAHGHGSCSSSGGGSSSSERKRRKRKKQETLPRLLRASPLLVRPPRAAGTLCSTMSTERKGWGELEEREKKRVTYLCCYFLSSQPQLGLFPVFAV